MRGSCRKDMQKLREEKAKELDKPAEDLEADELLTFWERELVYERFESQVYSKYREQTYKEWKESNEGKRATPAAQQQRKHVEDAHLIVKNRGCCTCPKEE